MEITNNEAKTKGDKKAQRLFIKFIEKISNKYGVSFDIDSLQVNISYVGNRINKIKLRPKKRFWQIW